MKSLGFWEATRPLRRFMVLTNQLQPPASFLRRAFWVFTYGSLFLSTILGLVKLVIDTMEKKESVYENAIAMIACLECCFRMVYLRVNQVDIYHLMARFQKFTVTSKSFAKSERKLQKNVAWCIKQNQFFTTLFGAIIILAYTVLRIILGKSLEVTKIKEKAAYTGNQLGSRIWLPYRDSEVWKTTPLYQVSLIFQMMVMAQFTCLYLTPDCLLFAFIIHLREAMKHLIRTKPSPKKKTNDIQTNSKDDECLNDCEILIRQHHYILTIAMELETLFSPIIFTSLLANGIITCTLAHILTKVKLNPAGIYASTAGLIFVGIKLFLVTSHGQTLIDESDRVNSSLPLKAWRMRNGSPEDQELHLINLFCRSTVKLTGMKFFKLSIEVFLKFCGIAIGYFIVLLQFQDK